MSGLTIDDNNYKGLRLVWLMQPSMWNICGRTSDGNQSQPVAGGSERRQYSAADVRVDDQTV